MMLNILAFGMPGIWEWVIIFIVFSLSFIIPFLVVFFIIRSFIRNKKEIQRLRLEVGKLADELEQLRKQNKNA